MYYLQKKTWKARIQKFQILLLEAGTFFIEGKSSQIYMWHYYTKVQMIVIITIMKNHYSNIFPFASNINI